MGGLTFLVDFNETFDINYICIVYELFIIQSWSVTYSVILYRVQVQSVSHVEHEFVFISHPLFVTFGF